MTKSLKMNDRPETDQVILATGGYDHTIRLWQTHSGLCYRIFQHPESQVNALRITPDKQLLASASYQHIFMYDMNSNSQTPVINYDGTSKNVTDIGFQVDGKWMYSGGEDAKVRLWDLKSKTNSQRQFDTSAPVTCVCLHPNQVELFVGDQNGVIYRWDLRTAHSEQLIPENDVMVLDVAIDPLGTHMAAVNSKGICYIWSLKSGKVDEPTKMTPKQKFQAHKRHVLSCEFSPDSRYLVTTSADQTAKIWQTTDFSLKQEFHKENQRWVWDAAFSADSQYIFTASSDGYPKIWDVESGSVIKEYAGHQKAVIALAFMDCAA